MKRCFIAINFDEEIKNKIVEIQKQLPEFLGKKTEIENLHLTLKFLGEIDDDKIKIVQEKLREIKFKKFFITGNLVLTLAPPKIRVLPSRGISMALVRCSISFISSNPP